jgi:dTDP-4-amino-4,6-dideoxygalactose transaminase
MKKENLDDLAIFGGTPAFGEKLHVGRPNLGNRVRFLERVNKILDGRWLTNNGPFVQEFERRIADTVGAKHCIVTCNATIALGITIRALGVRGEAIVPSFTAIATPHSLDWLGVRPVFCDIERRTHNMDASHVEELITPSTTAIVAVHLWGRPCAIDELCDIARRRKLKLIFDASHAFGCSYRTRMIGTFGNAEIFSFHATKYLNSFEGGAIVTNDDDLAVRVRLMRNYGFAGYDDVVSSGTNGKMTEVAAAMGLTSLESMGEFIDVNYRNYVRYKGKLADVPGISMLSYDENEKCNYQYIILEIDESANKINRNQIQRLLWAENVLARRYFYPGCHRMAPYRSRQPALRLPHTEELADRVLNLPNGTSINVENIDVICSILKFAIARGDEINQRIKDSPRSVPIPDR